MRYILFAFLLLLCFQGFGQSVNITTPGVSSVGLTVPSGFGVTGSPVTSSGTLGITTTLNGPVRGTGTGLTVGNLNLASEVTGVLPVANGGTGTGTALTQGSVVFAGASGVYSQNNSNLFWDNTNLRLGITKSNPAYTLDVGSNTIAFQGGSKVSQFIQYPSGLGATAMKHRWASGIAAMSFASNIDIFSPIAVDNPDIPSWVMQMGGGSGADFFQVRRAPAGSTSLTTFININGSGNVGINTTSQTERLHVLGNILANGSNAQFLGNDAGGSANNPTYSFAGDTDNGMYRPATNEIGFATNGAEKLRINSLGKISQTITNANFSAIFGTNAGSSNSLSGNYSTFFGYNSGRDNTTGAENTFVGGDAGLQNNTGSFNTYVGVAAGSGSTTGNRNVSIGNYSSFQIGSGNENVSIGYDAGRRFGTGTGGNLNFSGSVFIGHNTRALNSNQSNQIVIGHNAIGAGNNSVVLGNTSIVKTILRANVGIGISSDSTVTNTLDVNGSARIRTFTGTPKRLIGADYTGVLDTLVIGSGLSLTSGTLNTALTIAAGTWTPAINYAATGDTLTVLSASYTRLGTVVTYTIKAELQISTSNDITTYYIGLPVASNFTSINDASGTITRHRTGSVTQGENVDGLHKRLRADTGNDRLELQLDNSDNLNTTITITGQYIIK